MRLVLVFFLMLTIAIPMLSAVESGLQVASKTIFVPTDFPTIQEAIDNALGGDTVFVYNGTYLENVVVNKTVSVVGENVNGTFIDGDSVNFVVRIVAENVTITGFTIRNGSPVVDGAGILLENVRGANASSNTIISSYSGVSLVNSSLAIILNNKVSDCNLGICLNSSNTNVVQGNILQNASMATICAISSSNNTLQANKISDSKGYGIWLSYSPQNTVLDNEVARALEGITLISSPNSLVRNNSVTDSNGYGLGLESSRNSIVDRNSITNNIGGGVSISSSPNCNISKNTLLVNGNGVFVKVSNNTRIVDNVVIGNSGDGVSFSSSDNSRTEYNNITGNQGYGLISQISQSNIVSGNYMGNNTRPGIYLYIGGFDQVISNIVEYNEAGILIQSCPNSVVSKNEAVGNAREGVWLADSPNSYVSFNAIYNSGWEGLIFQNSGNSTANNNVAYGNAHFGIWLQNSSRININDCNVSSNSWDGIYVRECRNTAIARNNIHNNGIRPGDAGTRLYYCDIVAFEDNNLSGNRDGLRIFLSNNNSIHNNRIEQSTDYGINVLNSIGNRIYNNILVNNNVNAVSLNSSNAWDNGYPDGGNYWSDYSGLDAYWGPRQDQLGKDDIGDIPFLISSEIVDGYPLMVTSRFHDLTTTNAVLPFNEVYVGWIFSINVTVENNGGYVESFNVTTYCNSSVIQTYNVNSLTIDEVVTVALEWNTSGLTPCNLVSPKVEVVSYGAYHLNSTYVFGAVKVKMAGDMNGDGKVNIIDIAAIGTGLGAKAGMPRFTLNYDVNLDYVINIVDIGLAARNCGKTCL